MDPIKQTSLKPLPKEIKKRQFESIYSGQLPDDVIRDGINDIIYDNRKKLPSSANLTRIQIIRTHKIFRPELRVFVSLYGPPHGYFVPDGY